MYSGKGPAHGKALALVAAGRSGDRHYRASFSSDVNDGNFRQSGEVLNRYGWHGSYNVIATTTFPPIGGRDYDLKWAPEASSADNAPVGLEFNFGRVAAPVSVPAQPASNSRRDRPKLRANFVIWVPPNKRMAIARTMSSSVEPRGTSNSFSSAGERPTYAALIGTNYWRGKKFCFWRLGVRRTGSCTVACKTCVTGKTEAMKATWNGTVLAESNDTVVVEGNHYFPPESLNTEALEPSSTTSTCPWKGKASYYSVVAGGDKNADAAWYYPDPSDAASNIKDHVAFWKGVSVS